MTDHKQNAVSARSGQPSRRSMLGTLAAVPAVVIAPAVAMSSPHGDDRELFDAIAHYRKVREKVLDATVTLARFDEDLGASGGMFPKISDPGMTAEKLAALKAARAAKRDPLYAAMNNAWNDEQNALEQVCNIVPSTMPGVLSLLAFQRAVWDGDGPFESYLLSALCESAETALLKFT